MRWIYRSLTLSLALGFQSIGLAEQLELDYRGWHVDLARIAHVQPMERSRDAVCRQLDIVESVGLPPSILDFMRSVPLRANPTPDSLGAAHYSRRGGVEFHVRQLSPLKPIFLHELLHAYLEQRLQAQSGQLERFYTSTRASGRWQANAYMLQDAREFFAVTATVYLFGEIDRPPYTREQLREAQPDYYEWLSSVLGRRADLAS